MILRGTSRYVRAPIDKFGWYGLWLRHVLLKYIVDSTPVVSTLQNLRTPWLTRIMSFFSFLGTEDCFTCIIPLLTWILDARSGRLFTILLSIGFYAAGFFKCFFCLPRPPTPPIIPLHKEEGDWAFPSNHGTVGVLLPWYLAIYSYLHYDWWPWWARILLFVLTLVWFFGVTISRLYLGVHSLPDMAAGAIVGICILAVYILMDDYIDYQCVAGHYAVPKAFLLANILLYIHPRTNPETNSYGESVILTGTAVGIVASRTVSFSTYGRQSLLQSLETFDELPLQTLVWMSSLRLILGCSMIVGARIILKPSLRRVCHKFYAYLELPAYSYKDYAKQYPPSTKHYTDAYRLPPLSNCSSMTFDDSVQNEEASQEERYEKLVNGLRNRKNGKNKETTNLVKGKNKNTFKESMKSVSPVGFDDHAGGVDNDHHTDENENENDEEIVDSTNDPIDALPYDVDIPSRFIAYSLMGWILGEGAPAVFDLIGI